MRCIACRVAAIPLAMPRHTFRLLLLARCHLIRRYAMPLRAYAMPIIYFVTLILRSERGHVA